MLITNKLTSITKTIIIYDTNDTVEDMQVVPFWDFLEHNTFITHP